MTDIAAQILPALDALGVWFYWIAGLAIFLESVWLTGLVIPGTLAVDAGGALARLGHISPFDLAWFVFAGAALGGWLSFAAGRWISPRVQAEVPALQRALALFERRGGPAILLARFLGPLSGFTALAASLSGMQPHRFHLWNLLAAALFAVTHVALGYLAGDILARLGPLLPGVSLPLLALALLIGVLRMLVWQVSWGLPSLRRLLGILATRLRSLPPVRATIRRHPRTAAFLGARLSPTAGGLLATGLAALSLFLVTVFADNALDLTLTPDTGETDRRFAALMNAWWTPEGLDLAMWLTQLGHVPVATLVAVGTALAFLVAGRRAAAAGLIAAAAGNAITVTLLKLAFSRTRPDLAFFETSTHSFPSGHAGISVALYGTLAVLAWRERLIGPTTALVLGTGAALAIGGTRLYLLQHYLSDVLGGWTIGAIWLVLGLGLSEAIRRRAPNRPTRRLRLVAGWSAFAIVSSAAAWIAVSDPPTRAPLPEAQVTTLADPAAAIGTDAIPLDVVTLTGEALPPVSLVLEGAGPGEIAARLREAGWGDVPPPRLPSILAALRTSFTGENFEGATLPPGFNGSRPASETLRAPGSPAALRLWPAGSTRGGRPLTALAFAPEPGAAPGWSPETARAEVMDVLPIETHRTLTHEPRRSAPDAEGPAWSWNGDTILAVLPARP